MTKNSDNGKAERQITADEREWNNWIAFRDRVESNDPSIVAVWVNRGTYDSHFETQPRTGPRN